MSECLSLDVNSSSAEESNSSAPVSMSFEDTKETKEVVAIDTAEEIDKETEAACSSQNPIECLSSDVNSSSAVESDSPEHVSMLCEETKETKEVAAMGTSEEIDKELETTCSSQNLTECLSLEVNISSAVESNSHEPVRTSYEDTKESKEVEVIDTTEEIGKATEAIFSSKNEEGNEESKVNSSSNVLKETETPNEFPSYCSENKTESIKAVCPSPNSNETETTISTHKIKESEADIKTQNLDNREIESVSVNSTFEFEDSFSEGSIHIRVSEPFSLEEGLDSYKSESSSGEESENVGVKINESLSKNPNEKQKGSDQKGGGPEQCSVDAKIKNSDISSLVKPCLVIISDFKSNLKNPETSKQALDTEPNAIIHQTEKRGRGRPPKSKKDKLIIDSDKNSSSSETVDTPKRDESKMKSKISFESEKIVKPNESVNLFNTCNRKTSCERLETTENSRPVTGSECNKPPLYSLNPKDLIKKTLEKLMVVKCPQSQQHCENKGTNDNTLKVQSKQNKTIKDNVHLENMNNYNSTSADCRIVKRKDCEETKITEESITNESEVKSNEPLNGGNTNQLGLTIEISEQASKSRELVNRTLEKLTSKKISELNQEKTSTKEDNSKNICLSKEEILEKAKREEMHQKLVKLTLEKLTNRKLYQSTQNTSNLKNRAGNTPSLKQNMSEIGKEKLSQSISSQTLREVIPRKSKANKTYIVERKNTKGKIDNSPKPVMCKNEEPNHQQLNSSSTLRATIPRESKSRAKIFFPKKGKRKVKDSIENYKTSALKKEIEDKSKQGNMLSKLTSEGNNSVVENQSKLSPSKGVLNDNGIDNKINDSCSPDSGVTCPKGEQFENLSLIKRKETQPCKKFEVSCVKLSVSPQKDKYKENKEQINQISSTSSFKSEVTSKKLSKNQKGGKIFKKEREQPLKSLASEPDNKQTDKNLVDLTVNSEDSNQLKLLPSSKYSKLVNDGLKLSASLDKEMSGVNKDIQIIEIVTINDDDDEHNDTNSEQFSRTMTPLAHGSKDISDSSIQESVIKNSTTHDGNAVSLKDSGPNDLKNNIQKEHVTKSNLKEHLVSKRISKEPLLITSENPLSNKRKNTFPTPLSLGTKRIKKPFSLPIKVPNSNILQVPQQTADCIQTGTETLRTIKPQPVSKEIVTLPFQHSSPVKKVVSSSFPSGEIPISVSGGINSCPKYSKLKIDPSLKLPPNVPVSVHKQRKKSKNYYFTPLFVLDDGKVLPIQSSPLKVVDETCNTKAIENLHSSFVPSSTINLLPIQNVIGVSALPVKSSAKASSKLSTSDSNTSSSSINKSKNVEPGYVLQYGIPSFDKNLKTTMERKRSHSHMSSRSNELHNEIWPFTSSTDIETNSPSLKKIKYQTYHRTEYLSIDQRKTNTISPEHPTKWKICSNSQVISNETVHYAEMTASSSTDLKSRVSSSPKTSIEQRNSNVKSAKANEIFSEVSDSDSVFIANNQKLNSKQKNVTVSVPQNKHKVSDVPDDKNRQIYQINRHMKEQTQARTIIEENVCNKYVNKNATKKDSVQQLSENKQKENTVNIKIVKKRVKSKEEDLEEALDGVPPFIQEVFNCENIRHGFDNRDLIFVLSLLPDIEEMTTTQRVIFQLRAIKVLEEVFNSKNPKMDT